MVNGNVCVCVVLLRIRLCDGVKLYLICPKHKCLFVFHKRMSHLSIFYLTKKAYSCVGAQEIEHSKNIDHIFLLGFSLLFSHAQLEGKLQLVACVCVCVQRKQTGDNVLMYVSYTLFHNQNSSFWYDSYNLSLQFSFLFMKMKMNKQRCRRKF